MSLLAYKDKNRIEAGADEAGRGCLAGPVVAAAVILDPKHPIKGLDDSKKLSVKKRIALKLEIEKKAMAFAVCFVDHKTIDQINILNASFLAMENAIKALGVSPEFLLIDGHRFKTSLDIPFSCEIKGDARFMSIAAASILAKTNRDAYMQRIDLEYPSYAWKKNKGYPTLEHRKAVLDIGLSPYHRKSFQLKQKQLSLSL